MYVERGERKKFKRKWEEKGILEEEKGESYFEECRIEKKNFIRRKREEYYFEEDRNNGRRILEEEEEWRGKFYMKEE